MRFQLMLFFLFIVIANTYGQSLLTSYIYEPSPQHPFGRANPEAPVQIRDYEPFIGLNDCKSLTRDNQGLWRKDSINVIWRFKYIMNGLAVQDESLKEDGTHTSSIRVYDKEAKKWYVTFFSSGMAAKSPITWAGEKKDNRIILYADQKAPNGADGLYKITFDNISNKGFDWVGEWVNPDETFSFVTWQLFCTKRQTNK